jgi:hypothetical protein
MGIPDSAPEPAATVPPRVRDRATRLGCHCLAAAWSVLGLRQAGAMLRHYLRGGGRPRVADAAALLAAPAVRDAVDDQLALWRSEALLRWAEAGRAEAVYPAESGWRGLVIDRRRSLDWWLALRVLRFRLTGSVHVAADGAVTVDHRFQLHQRWSAGPSSGECVVPAVLRAPCARLRATGLARDFEVMGESVGLTYDGPAAARLRAPRTATTDPV